MRYLLFVILLMSTLCRAQAMEVRYYDRGMKDARHAYKFELIRAILESTRTEYGEYTIIPFAEEPSAKRQSLLISDGKILNLLWAAPGTAIATGDVITIPVDILRGLLGFRVCLINPANFPTGPQTISHTGQAYCAGLKKTAGQWRV